MQNSPYTLLPNILGIADFEGTCHLNVPINLPGGAREGRGEEGGVLRGGVRG